MLGKIWMVSLVSDISYRLAEPKRRMKWVEPAQECMQRLEVASEASDNDE